MQPMTIWNVKKLCTEHNDIESIVAGMIRHFVAVTIYIQLQFLFEKLHANLVQVYSHEKYIESISFGFVVNTRYSIR